MPAYWSAFEKKKHPRPDRGKWANASCVLKKDPSLVTCNFNRGDTTGFDFGESAGPGTETFARDLFYCDN